MLWLLLFPACKKEDPLEREKRELKEALESDAVLPYKALKAGLRSLPPQAMAAPGDLSGVGRANLIREAKPDLDAQEIYLLTYHLLATASQMKDTMRPMSVTEYIAVGAEIAALREKLKEIDEDKYPTVLENISRFVDPLSGNQFIPEGYNASYEHLLLALIWMGTPSMPKPVSLYELSHSAPENIKEPDIRLFSYLLRAISFLTNKWPLLSEVESTGYLECLDDNRDFLVKKYPQPLFPGAKVSGEEAAYRQCHAVGVLIRAMARLETDKTAAIEDLESFVEDAEAIGLDNELVWFAGALAGIEKEDEEKADLYLSKLERSKILTEDEKAMIKETRQYLKDRDKESAFVKISDGAFVAKMGIHLGTEVLKQEARYGNMENSKHGKTFISLSGSIEEAHGAISKYLNPGDLIDKGKELLEVN